MEKQEIIRRLNGARSWREAGVPIQDVCKALLESGEGVSTPANSTAEKELSELREKVSRLTETNKQLRAENKQLRSGK